MDEKRIKGKDVAKACGVKSPTITGWRNGEYLPDNAKRLKLSKLFGVSVDYLVFGNTEKKLGDSEFIQQGVRDSTTTDGPKHLDSGEIEKECREHFEEFIKKARTQSGALGWTLVTLRAALPLDKWGKDERLSTKEKIIEEFRRTDPNPGILDEPIVKKHLDVAVIEKPEDLSHVFAAAAIEYGKESSRKWEEANAAKKTSQKQN